MGTIIYNSQESKKNISFVLPFLSGNRFLDLHLSSIRKL